MHLLQYLLAISTACLVRLGTAYPGSPSTQNDCEPSFPGSNSKVYKPFSDLPYYLTKRDPAFFARSLIRRTQLDGQRRGPIPSGERLHPTTGGLRPAKPPEVPLYGSDSDSDLYLDSGGAPTSQAEPAGADSKDKGNDKDKVAPGIPEPTGSAAPDVRSADSVHEPSPPPAAGVPDSRQATPGPPTPGPSTIRAANAPQVKSTGKHATRKKCRYCDHMPKDYRQHVEEVHPEKLTEKCEKCPKKFDTGPALDKHKSYHKKAEQPKHICPLCQKVYTYERRLTKHLETCKAALVV